MILGNYISSVIESTKRIVKIYAFGKSDVRTATQYTPAGIDSSPIEGMKAIYAKTSRSTEPVVVGYLNISEVEDGEIQIFSFNSDGKKAYVKCNLNDEVEINGNDDYATAFNDMKDAFDELKGDLNTFITTKYNLHTHAFTGGTTAVTTSLGSSSSADMSSAKVETVRLP